MLLLHCWLPAVSPSLYSWGNIASTHIQKHSHTLSPSLWDPLQGIIKCKCSTDIKQARHNTKCTIEAQQSTHQMNTARLDVRAPIHTFARHTGIPGIVSLLGRLIAHCVATLGPSQDTEGPVQPPEGAAPHWRTFKVSDCEGSRGEREALYRFPHPEHAWTCLNLPPHSQWNAFTLVKLRSVLWKMWKDEIPVWSRRFSLHTKTITFQCQSSAQYETSLYYVVRSQQTFSPSVLIVR